LLYLFTVTSGDNCLKMFMIATCIPNRFTHITLDHRIVFVLNIMLVITLAISTLNALDLILEMQYRIIAVVVVVVDANRR